MGKSNTIVCTPSLPMVKDLRTEVETSQTTSVLDGDLDMFIEEELRQLS